MRCLMKEMTVKASDLPIVIKYEKKNTYSKQPQKG